MVHVLKYRSCNEIYGRGWSEDNPMFIAIKANNVCKYSCFYSLGDRHETRSAGMWSTTRSCYVFRERPLRAQVFNTHFRNGQISVALIDQGHFLLTVLDYTRRGAQATLDITTVSVLEVQMFSPSRAVLKKAIEART